MNRLLSAVKRLLRAGLLHIFGASVINNVISFASAFFIVKIISKSEMDYVYDVNLKVNFPLLILGLGIAAGLLQYASEKRSEEEKLGFFKFGLKYSSIVNAILSFGLFIFTFTKTVDPIIAPFVRILSLFPLVEGIFQIFSTYLRVEKRNKEYSHMLNIDSIVQVVSILSGALLFGWKGAVLGKYFGHLAAITYFLIKCNSDYKKIMAATLVTKDARIDIVKYSFILALSNMVSQAMTLVDQQIIRNVSVPGSLATYATMTKIPNALAFIPISIMVFVYPYFASNNKNKKWLKENLVKMYLAMAGINLLIALPLYVFAPTIIRIFASKEYSIDGVGIFRVLVINYFFLATLRIPSGNVLAMLKKARFNFLVSIITGIATVTLDLILIPTYGSIGATYAYLSVVLFSSAIMIPYVIWTIYKLPKEEAPMGEELIKQ